MKYLGCAYYPEYWGVDRVETDAKLMKAAGINIVRIGEFAWTPMEKEEGIFDLGWLHQSVEILGKYGIEVMMCTPSATPPAWLTANYPDVLLVRGDGSRTIHGSRRHYCSTSDNFRRHCRRIAEKLSLEMSRHRNVVAWQIDNELGPEAGWCHCQNCQARFRAWLKARYGTVDELNRRWKTAFWSVVFTDWSQVTLEDGRIEMYSSQKLDSRRFWSDMMIDFGIEQAEILRKNHPSAIVTTNGMGPIFSPMDYYKLYEKLDVACDDLYFDISTMDADAMAMNVFRQVKPNKKFWLTETGSGALDHNKPPHKDQFRAWAWSSFAHGADAHMVFRWRTCLSGHEQELQGIIEHSGKPRHRYEAVKKCFLEFASLREKLSSLPLPVAPVAIIQDYETLWAYEASRIGRDVDYFGLVTRIHKEFYRRNILVDLIPVGRDLKKYKLVVLPSTMLVSPELAAGLKDFVKSGGTVLAVGQIGMRDFNDNYVTSAPENLQDIFGIRIEGGMYLKDFCGTDRTLFFGNISQQIEVGINGALDGTEVSGTAKVWIGDLSLDGAEALLSFSEDTFKGQAAITENKTGKGRAIYSTAVRMSDDLETKLIDHAISVSGVKCGPETKLHVEVIRRGNAIFAINHNPESTEVVLGVKGKALIGGYKDGKAVLPAYGVCVVEV